MPSFERNPIASVVAEVDRALTTPMKTKAKAQTRVLKIAAVAAILAFLIRPMRTIERYPGYVGDSSFWDAIVGGGEYTGTFMHSDLRLLGLEYVAIADVTVVSYRLLGRTRRS